jgi:hypothetical protein
MGALTEHHRCPRGPIRRLADALSTGGSIVVSGPGANGIYAQSSGAGSPSGPAVTDAARTVYSVKRFMGKGPDDVRDEASLLPFRVSGETGGALRRSASLSFLGSPPSRPTTHVAASSSPGRRHSK